MSMQKKIAVIFGGKSAEHDVSIITAHIPIIQSLQAAGLPAALPNLTVKGDVVLLQNDWPDQYA